MSDATDSAAAVADVVPETLAADAERRDHTDTADYDTGLGGCPHGGSYNSGPVDAHRRAARAFAWTGAVLFVTALAYFLFAYAVTFGEITPGTLEIRAVMIDIALFSAFALHHSIFARNPVRAFVRRSVSAGLERSVYVWVASLMLIGVCAGWNAVPGALWQVPRPWAWLLLAVQLGGVWLTLRGAAVIDAFELAGVREASGVGTWGFKTEGPYGWVRHPIYLGWMVLVFAVGTMTMTRFVFAVVSSVYILIAIPFEERTLRRNSGGAYDDYMRRVPARLIPRLYSLLVVVLLWQAFQLLQEHDVLVRRNLEPLPAALARNVGVDAHQVVLHLGKHRSGAFV